MDRKKHILFLCTGNACRSQMAEGWMRHLAGGWIEVASAGIEAHGKNPRAVAIMAESGIDISQQDSTQWTPAMLDRADMVVTVCAHADELCPILPPGKTRVHWPLDDPARATGTESQITETFRRTRDDIKARVQDLITRLQKDNFEEP